jgi:hypothetical protein
MAVPTGTYQRYTAVGLREDLENIIYDISPTDTPFMSNVTRKKATSTFHEWQTDTLDAAVSTNAQIEGDEANTNTASPTSRFGNYTQIMTKVPRVSGTLRASDAAGRRDELSYQIAKRGRELKRDMESAFLGTQAATTGAAASARTMAGVAAWLFDNTVANGSAATTVAVTSGAPLTAPTSGTAATFSEAMLKSAIKKCWDEGGSPNLVMVGSFNKQIASAFAGIATQYRDNQQTGPATIIGSADIYVSDFGQHQIVANRFMPSNQVYCLDMEYWSVAYLRPIQNVELAKTGDSDRSMILTECTVIADNPKASAKVYAVTTS